MLSLIFQIYFCSKCGFIRIQAGFSEVFTWEQRKFEDIAARSSSMSTESGLPRVEYEDIISGTGRLNKDIFAKGSEKAGIVFHKGDVLYGKLRPYLQNWLLPSFNGLAVGDFWVLQPQNAESSFLYRLIQSRQFDEVANQSTGTKMPRADWKLVSKTEFYIPHSLDEQSVIGAYFTNLDDLITLHQRMCVSFGCTLQIRKDSPFAFAWEQRKLSEIADIVGGGTPSTNNPEYWDGDIDWYAPAEMEGQRYAVGSVKKITELGLQKSSATMLPAGKTVLFTSRAGIGKMAILQRSAATNQGFQSMVLKDDTNPYFIYSMGSEIKKKAEGVASGSTFLEISGKMLGNLVIAVPSTMEQDKIASYFRSLDDLITLHQRKQKADINSVM